MRGWLFFMGCALALGCGGAAPHRSDAPTAGAATADAAECRRVVARYDAIDQDLAKLEGRFGSSDLAIVAVAFRGLEDALEHAGADFEAMTLADASLGAFARDTAAVARSQAKTSHDATALLKRITGAHTLSKSTIAVIKDHARAVAEACRDQKTDECTAVLGWVQNLPEGDSDVTLADYVRTGRQIHVASATLKGAFDQVLADFDDLATASHDAQEANQAFGKLMDAIGNDKRGDALDQRLHTLCGRPIPAKKEQPSQPANAAATP